ncbi:flavin transferase [Pontimonas salivibrio]|uniref:FAD:protein FMN transferase n=1 Tax=Pontimonas salivibrio TaxID=1159327 RepID=A0A2L2BNZ0_9MICO|nr:FAD:protein FMN transferase [Pontimonas salivibrio]AVG23374.1 flavin transferase [Pontimonas salivibrio]
MTTWRFDAIGVPWVIDTSVTLPETLRQAISTRIDEFDRTYSRFRGDSLVAQVSSEAGEYLFPPDIVDLFSLYESLYTATGGALSPVVGNALEHWGYDAQYRLEPAAGRPPSIPRFSDVLSLEGNTLLAPRPVSIDIGAAGKGYLVDEVFRIVREAGIEDVVVDASGDIRAHTSAPERVGMEHPGNPERVVGVVELSGQSLASSSPNRRSWAPGVHHILDALTGLPTSTIRASWVVAAECAVADGLATALFVVKPEVLEEYFSFQWAIIDGHGVLTHSTDFPGEVYP